MKAYDAGGTAYFATPPVNMIYAYHASLLQITNGKPSLEERFKLHQQASRRIRAVTDQLGMKPVPKNEANSANGMTAVSQLHSAEHLCTHTPCRFTFQAGWRHLIFSRDSLRRELWWRVGCTRISKVCLITILNHSIANQHLDKYIRIG